MFSQSCISNRKAKFSLSGVQSAEFAINGKLLGARRLSLQFATKRHMRLNSCKVVNVELGNRFEFISSCFWFCNEWTILILVLYLQCYFSQVENRSYPIYIGKNIINADVLKKHIGDQALLVTNETIAPLYLERLSTVLPSKKLVHVILPDGEKFKTLESLNVIWNEALKSKLGRDSTFVALGGGVVGDMTGFAAATYQRGVNFVQIPTTIMAMVDSSVGGKTGINHELGKNMIGSFHQPSCVLIDTSTIKSLPMREYMSGLSEVIKYGLIRDSDFFNWFLHNVQKIIERDERVLQELIQRSCINKALVVSEDEKESGLRATLNLGHTFGHAIETWQGYGVWLHGEAVAAGIVMAAKFSLHLGWINADLVEKIENLFATLNLPIKPPQGMDAKAFLNLMAIDKKVQDGQLRLILLKGALGDCVINAVDQNELRQFLSNYGCQE